MLPPTGRHPSGCRSNYLDFTLSPCSSSATSFHPTLHINFFIQKHSIFAHSYSSVALIRHYEINTDQGIITDHNYFIQICHGFNWSIYVSAKAFTASSRASGAFSCGTLYRVLRYALELAHIASESAYIRQSCHDIYDRNTVWIHIVKFEVPAS